MTRNEYPELSALIDVMARLRGDDGCAWDREQTHESLVKYLIEESYELVDAIESGDRAHIREELGDVLYQILFHADIAAADSTDPFDIDDVARETRLKMVGRHPHVFGDVVADTSEDVVANWERWKAEEKPERSSRFEGLPKGLPALVLADKVMGKLNEGLFMSDMNSSTGSEDELGDMLLGIVALARAQGFDAERALRNAVRRLIAENEN